MVDLKTNFVDGNYIGAGAAATNPNLGSFNSFTNAINLVTGSVNTIASQAFLCLQSSMLNPTILMDTKTLLGSIGVSANTMGGSCFLMGEVEIITQVKGDTSFMAYNIGSIEVHSAGGSSTIRLFGEDDPASFYDTISAIKTSDCAGSLYYRIPYGFFTTYNPTANQVSNGFTFVFYGESDNLIGAGIGSVTLRSFYAIGGRI